MNIHDLKCWPEYFQPVIEGKKTVELRMNDRGFRVGDRLLLREWKRSGAHSPSGEPLGDYTGRSTTMIVTHIVDESGAFPAPRWLRSGVVALSIAPVEKKPQVLWEDGVTENGLYGMFGGPDWRSSDKDKWIMVVLQKHIIIHQNTPAAVLAENLKPDASGKTLIIVSDTKYLPEIFKRIKEETGEQTSIPPPDLME
jgi:hypothetical protein